MADLYLYNSGLYGSNWTDGPSYNGSFAFTDGTELNLHGNESSQQWGTFVTVSGVDFTGYDTLEINSSRISSAGVPVAKMFIGIASSSTAEYPSGYDILVEHNMSDSIINVTDSINIASYTGNYYIYGGTYTDGNNSTTDTYFSHVRLIESTGEPPVDNYGAVGVENTPELYLSVDGYYSLATATGQVGSSIGNMTSNSTAYSNNNTYGFVNNYQLDGLGFITDNQLTILGSTSGNLNNLTALSIIGNTSANFGNAYESALGSVSLNASGYQNGTIAGYVLSSLRDVVTVNASGGNYGSSGTSSQFKYTSEQQRFIGRSCNVLNLENNKVLTKSCFSMLKPNPVTIYPKNITYEVCKCDCTVDIPIYLNRVHNEDVKLVYNTIQRVSNIIYEDELFIPAIIDSDFYYMSGEVTVVAGNIYVNFPIDIINDTGNLNNTYFTLQFLRNTTNNICGGGNFNVVIKDCSNTCLYRWTYTIDSYWTGLGWELVTDNCSSGIATQPSSPGEYVGEERYGTCTI